MVEMLIFVAVLFVGCVLYFMGGGIGGAVAHARARPPAPLPAPQPATPLPSGIDRLAEIEAFHANELNAITITIAELVPDLIKGVSFARLGRSIAEKHAHLDRRADEDDHLLHVAGGVQREYLNKAAELALRGASFRRTLRDMSEAERATLRIADLLAQAAVIDRRERLAIFAPIVWNQGKGMLIQGNTLKSADLLAEVRTTLTTLIEGHLGPVGQATERMQQALRDALGEGRYRLTTREREVLQRLLVTGARWMTAEEAATALVYDPGNIRSSALRLGQIEGSETELLYDRNESLITFGPPGQGKSQSLMRNLLTMKGGALVLDIKGELFEKTAVWRRENVGPVYRFAPADPLNSIHFNPLDTIRRTSVADAFEDAQTLVDLLMVPKDVGAKDYWDRRGLELLADALLDAVLFNDGPSTMSSVFDRLYLNSEVDRNEGHRPPPRRTQRSARRKRAMPVEEKSELEYWLDHLQQTGVSKLKNTATALRTMPPKVRESVTDTARSHVGTWQSPRIEELSGQTTFDPLSLRHESATLYICITLKELAQYRSFFRALIGQTFYALCREDVGRDAPVVTFFLDEMPKLNNLDVLESALDMGRGYGVRMWMFAQNFGQLVEHYKNPDGFLDNTLVRQFMGISPKRALELSKQLGERHGLIDGERKPLVFPHELTGDAFRDLTLTDPQGYSPARVLKAYGYKEYGDRIMSVKGHDYSGGILKLRE